MKDLTKGSIVGHMLSMASPVGLVLLTQIAYQLVDLYFVTRIGAAATAGLSAANNAMLIVNALTQVLGVGTVALMAHAVGRKDHADANLIFNQSAVVSVVCAVATMMVLFSLTQPYLRWVAVDAATIEAGITFMYWVLPGYALMFPMIAVSSALRGTGVVQPTIIVYAVTFIAKALLAPILIAGWGTGTALGVRGAALATSISVVLGILFLCWHFHRSPRYVSIQLNLLRPQLRQWRRIASVGLPAGGEFALMFLYTAVVYYTIRDFGASAQAGFGIGSRLLQTIVLPGMSIAFAAGPIAGQNFGACNEARVRETFRQAVLLGSVISLITTLLVQWQPAVLVSAFDTDAASRSVAELFLQLMSWTFVAQGLVYTCTTMFQGLGDTLPSLTSSATRLLVFSIPALWLSTQSGFRIEHVWYLSIASVLLQAAVSVSLLHSQFKKRLPQLAPTLATSVRDGVD